MEESGGSKYNVALISGGITFFAIWFYRSLYKHKEYYFALLDGNAPEIAPKDFEFCAVLMLPVFMYVIKNISLKAKEKPAITRAATGVGVAVFLYVPAVIAGLLLLMIYSYIVSLF